MNRRQAITGIVASAALPTAVLASPADHNTLVQRLEASGDPLCLEAVERIKSIWRTHVRFMETVQENGYDIRLDDAFPRCPKTYSRRDEYGRERFKLVKRKADPTAA